MPKPLPVLDSATAVVCCAPLASAPLSTDEAKTLAGQLKALADPARLRLLSLMMANDDLEACTCDLTEAGLVFAHRRQGPWTYYRVIPDALSGLAHVIAPVGAGMTPSATR